MKSGPSSAALAASMNRWIAPESFAMPASCSGEALVVSGAATPPARTAARNTSAYSTLEVPRIATDCPRCNPVSTSRAASLSTSPTSSAQCTSRRSSTKARSSPLICDHSIRISGKEPKGSARRAVIIAVFMQICITGPKPSAKGLEGG